MARGWESKSVESQIEDAGRSAAPEASLSPDERRRQQKRASLELSRRRVLTDLAAAGSEVRRASLRLALDFLDEEIRRLEE